MEPIEPNAFREANRPFEIPEPVAAQRLEELRKRYPDLDRWKVRAREIRAGILTATGISQDEVRDPISSRVTVVSTQRGYRVSTVAFESRPGHYVTGNLYEPLEQTYSMPGILSPHGHFEREGGRFSAMVQIRCAALAAMGCIVFAYDMVGWGDSLRVSHTDDNVLAYQLHNSIRAIDFLLTVPGVDPRRIGVTGASGGGTQAILLGAVDERVALSVPVVMVSAHYAGGCVCESGLPIREATGTNNAEIAACFAPRPQLVISVGTDFTKNTPRVEFPFIRSRYALFARARSVENVHFFAGSHDYGSFKRLAMYQFVARHFSVPPDFAVAMEESYTLLPLSMLRVRL